MIGHRHQPVGGVVELHAGDLERHDAIRVSQFRDVEAHLLDEHREGIVGVARHGERGRPGGQVDQVRVLCRSRLDAHHELHRENAVAPLEASLDLVAILRSRAREEAGPEVVLPGRFHGHELLGAAAGKVVDAVERQRGDHPGIEFMRRRDRWQRDAAGRGVLASGHTFDRAHRARAARLFLIDSFHDLTAQPTSISSSTAEPPGRICCTNEKYGNSRPVGVRGSQGRNDDIRVRTAAAYGDVAQREAHRPCEELRRGVLGKLKRRHVVMRLEKLRRELVALADFSPVILVHRDLRPRLGIEVGMTPDGRRRIRRPDGGLFAESPAFHQFVDVCHAIFSPQPELPVLGPRRRRRGNLMPTGDHERCELSAVASTSFTSPSGDCMRPSP